MAGNTVLRFMRVIFPTLLLGLWLGTGSCSTPGSRATVDEEGAADQNQLAVERIRDLVRMWASDLNRGNAASAVELYSRDVVYMPPGQPPLQGSEQVQRFLEQMFPSGRSSLTYSSREIQVSGDLAYERGVFVRMAGNSGTGSGSRNGNLLRVFRRDEDGAWKVTREIWNVSLDSNETEQPDSSSRQ